MKSGQSSKAKVARIKPSDVFEGSRVRRKFRAAVVSLVRENAQSTYRSIRGSMISSVEDVTWAVFGGEARFMAGTFGFQAQLSVEDESVRARLMLLMGVDLTRSRIYQKHAPAPDIG